MKKAIIAALFGLLFILSGCATSNYSQTSDSSLDIEEVVVSPEIFDFEEIEYDFGVILQSGGIVSYEFPFTYNGEETIIVTGVPTSCACTTAEIDKTTFEPGDKGVVTVFFNPNLHEEPEGRFFKTITVLTAPELEEEPDLKIWVEIDLDLGPEAYELQQHVD